MTSKKLNKGHLFVFEGPDGVGKTSLIAALYKDLDSKGFPVEKLSFPGKKPQSLGALVYKIHHNSKAFELSNLYPPSLQVMHIAAHAEAINNQIIPLYKDNTIILLDRYWWSTVVYGKVEGIKESILNSMIELELLFWENVEPDELFLLERDSSLKEEDENLDKWLEIKKEYSLLSIEENGKYPISLIHNNGVFEEALNKITNRISEKIQNG